MFGCNLENVPKKFQAFRLYEEKEFVKTQNLPYQHLSQYNLTKF